MGGVSLGMMFITKEASREAGNCGIDASTIRFTSAAWRVPPVRGTAEKRGLHRKSQSRQKNRGNCFLSDGAVATSRSGWMRMGFNGAAEGVAEWGVRDSSQTPG